MTASIYEHNRRTGKEAWANFALKSMILSAKDGDKIAMPQLNGETIILTVERRKPETEAAKAYLKGVDDV